MSNKPDEDRHRQGKDDTIPISVSLGSARDSSAHLKSRRTSRQLSFRVLLLSLQVIFNAIIIGFIAKGLVLLIDLITNLSFYGRFSFESAAPGIAHWGWLTVLVPVLGGIVAGLMARFGSAGIRGHGIPEAMEQVLLNESKIHPPLTYLKPVSSAIVIGTGGPFGAEGPIIATGGALGSLAGQIMRISARERKIMLTAGACAGMAAIFGTPLAAVLLAIELLLFEFSPRSIIPVAISCVTGAAMHFLLFGTEPVFAMSAIDEPSSVAVITYTFLGLVIGVIASFVSRSIYLIEDLFEKLPVHWMWWPAIGGVAVGIIGYFAPRTMGVGYFNIEQLLTGNLPLFILIQLCVLKFISWAIALSSGTSGGTLAPLFTIGGALGALLGLVTLHFIPLSGIHIATAALIGMAAMFAGSARALLTSIVFALETTGQLNGLLPLVGACTASYFISFFFMRGSIMTEKIERRGISPPGTFEPDVLQQILTREVMDGNIVVIDKDLTAVECQALLSDKKLSGNQMLVAVDKDNEFAGYATVRDIYNKSGSKRANDSKLWHQASTFIQTKTPLSQVVNVMAETRANVLPVIDTHNHLSGIITYRHILNAYHSSRGKDSRVTRAITFQDWAQRRGIKIRKFGGSNKDN